MSNYTADQIRTMDYIEHIRQYPGMYCSSKGADGLHHLVKEILSNSIDEYLNGNCDTIAVYLSQEKNQITIIDNGRGIPHGIREDGMSTLQAAFGEAMTGGKFDNKTGESGYNTSGGQHGQF